MGSFLRDGDLSKMLVRKGSILRNCPVSLDSTLGLDYVEKPANQVTSKFKKRVKAMELLDHLTGGDNHENDNGGFQWRRRRISNLGEQTVSQSEIDNDLLSVTMNIGSHGVVSSVAGSAATSQVGSTSQVASQATVGSTATTTVSENSEGKFSFKKNHDNKQMKLRKREKKEQECNEADDSSTFLRKESSTKKTKRKAGGAKIKRRDLKGELHTLVRQKHVEGNERKRVGDDMLSQKSILVQGPKEIYESMKRYNELLEMLGGETSLTRKKSIRMEPVNRDVPLSDGGKVRSRDAISRTLTLFSPLQVKKLWKKKEVTT